MLPGAQTVSKSSKKTLPSLVARDIEKGLKAYLKGEFPVAGEGFVNEDGKSVLEDFLEKPESLVKGPWVEVNLPFRSDPESKPPFETLDINTLIPGFVPYAHQQKAFQRLAWRTAKSTLVATGTGSGKTECFLLPILDYCLSSRKKGVKALLIYPMNALAADQNKRLEKLTKNLPKPGVSFGLYTGDTDTPEREKLLKNPPDILLTNYKMLDYLLIRPHEQAIWAGNGPDVLRYLVVDELHTFDGAQGTDLACLIRRLRERLNLGETLACVGTSATMGDKESLADLRTYAANIFASPFPSESVIEEDRLSATEYLAPFEKESTLGLWPGVDLLEVAESAGSAPEYLRDTVQAWFGDTMGFTGEEAPQNAVLQLGKSLPRLAGFKSLLRRLEGPTRVQDIAAFWAAQPETFPQGMRQADRLTLAQARVESLVAMISAARSKTGERTTPFLTVRSQLWIRTLTRAVATVSRSPRLFLDADLPTLTEPLALPIVGCRECGNTAWLASPEGGVESVGARAKPALTSIYAHWFSDHPDTALFYPITQKAAYERAGRRERTYQLCSACGKLTFVGNRSWEELDTEDGHRCSCGCTETVFVWVPNMRSSKSVNGNTVSVLKKDCPHCRAAGSLRIFGAAGASLSAAAIDLLHASPYNDDNKLIAFSDSVQDAAHRSGFYNARDYIACVRHALVSYLAAKDTGGKDPDMAKVLKGVAEYHLARMKQDFAGRDEAETLAKAAFLATFVPPDKEHVYGWKLFSEAAQGAFDPHTGKPAANSSESSAKIISTYCDDKGIGWKSFFESTKERLTWECFMELTHRSENGRTAMKALSAALYPDTDKLRLAARDFCKAMGNVFPQAQISEKIALFYLTGLADRVRLSGAFAPEGFKNAGAPTAAKDFGLFVYEDKDWLAFNKSWVLPTYGKTYRPPAPLTLIQTKTKDFTTVLYRPGRETWFTAWTKKLLSPVFPLIDNALLDVLKTAMKALAEVGLVRAFTREQTDAWVSDFTNWKVSRSVHAWRCTCCGRRFFAASRSDKLRQGLPCLSPSCTGTLTEDESAQENAIYTAPPVRINAHEHTALVDANTRALIENSFGKTSDPWSVNLLSATPTLEMGIDIGDLSTVLLGSMPPTKANFLQRIGRAGRRDGNALALTMIDKSAHEQYFWEDPDRMMRGKVSTPGVFLEAICVLERQLFAFAFGDWVAKNPEIAERLPKNVKGVIDNLKKDDQNRFPNAFLTWVSENTENIFARFAKLFDWGAGALSGERSHQAARIRYSLKNFLSGSDTGARESLATRFRRELSAAQLEIEDLKRKRDDIRKRRRTLDSRPDDEAKKAELETLEEQSKAYEKLYISYCDKSFFQLLSDIGFEPNYAFPEEGVQVQSVIIKQKSSKPAQNEGQSGKTASQSTSTADTFEFSRAAASALHELSPGSTFYINGYKLKVDQLAIDRGSFDEWRFCPVCPHMEPAVTGDEPHDCPICGSERLFDPGQKKKLLRVRSVTAVADAKSDRILDDKDTRSVDPQTTQLFIEANPKDVANAWKIDDRNFSFGFEFLKKATIRQINFGRKRPGLTAGSFLLNGKEYPDTGFAICKVCGKVRNPAKGARGFAEHDVNCPYYDEKNAPEDSAWTQGLFLYREVTSEAIRIRLPVSISVDEAGGMKSVSSFIAALKLGLRKHFKGNTDHLMVALQNEPDRTNPQNVSSFVVIYDTVPGGTGYLKELGSFDDDQSQASPRVMLQVMREALTQLTSCTCTRDPDKDGCYECVYNYRDSTSRENISRKEAERLINRILSYPSEKIVPAQGSIANLPGSEFSALEQLLLRRLQGIPGAETSAAPLKTGENAYLITVPVTDQTRPHWERLLKDKAHDVKHFTWQLRLQVDFAGDRPSRPDFVLAPLNETLRAAEPSLTACLFSDGWEYHRNKVTEDTEKRQSLINQGYRVFTLTWDDLRALSEEDIREGKTPPAFGTVLANTQGAQSKPALSAWSGFTGIALKDESGNSKRADILVADAFSILTGKTSFDWLTSWLLDPVGFAQSMRSAATLAAFSQGLTQSLPAYLAPIAHATQFAPQALYTQKTGGAYFDFMSAFFAEKDKAGKNQMILAAAARFNTDISEGTEHEHRTAWAAFWQNANALQFLPRSWCCTQENEGHPLFEQYFKPEEFRAPASVAPNAAEESAWENLHQDLTGEDEEFFAHILALFGPLSKIGIPEPDDLTDGWPGCSCCAGQGLFWKRENKSVYLFADEDLFEEKKGLTRETGDGFIAIGTADPDWLNTVKSALTQ